MNECIISFSHSNYLIKSAGVEKFIKDETEIIREHGLSFIHIFPVIEINKFFDKCGSSNCFAGVNYNNRFLAIVNLNRLYAYISGILRKNDLNAIGIQVHHLHGWNTKKLAGIVMKLNLPVKIFIHDYDTVCPYIMFENANSHCRYDIKNPSVDHCGRCVYLQNGMAYNESIHQFLNLISAQIVNIYTPSQNTRENWIKSFAEYSNLVKVRPHLQYALVANTHVVNHPLRLAYAGSTATHKGYQEWMKLIDHLNRSRYELYYFGDAQVDDKRVNTVRVDFQDKTLPSMVEQLKTHDIDIVFLWSNCQETYCYTLFEAWAAGCYILTSNHSGNVTDAVSKHSNGKVFNSIESCIEYLSSPQIENDISTYIKDEKVPEVLKPNDHFEDLVFAYDRHNIKDNKLPLPNLFLTILYKLLRAK